MPIARLGQFQPRPWGQAGRSFKHLQQKEIRYLTERKVDAFAPTAYMDTNPIPIAQPRRPSTRTDQNMLEALRRGVKGIFMQALLGLLVIAFATTPLSRISRAILRHDAPVCLHASGARPRR